jgi:hypothetical protein
MISLQDYKKPLCDVLSFDLHINGLFLIASYADGCVKLWNIPNLNDQIINKEILTIETPIY